MSDLDEEMRDLYALTLETEEAGATTRDELARLVAQAREDGMTLDGIARVLSAVRPISRQAVWMMLRRVQ